MRLRIICLVFVVLIESLLAQRFGHGYPGGGGIYPGGGGFYPGGDDFYPGGGGYPGFGCRCRRYCFRNERYSGRCRRGGGFYPRPFYPHRRRRVLCCPIYGPYGPFGGGRGGFGGGRF